MKNYKKGIIPIAVVVGGVLIIGAITIGVGVYVSNPEWQSTEKVGSENNIVSTSSPAKTIGKSVVTSVYPKSEASDYKVYTASDGSFSVHYPKTFIANNSFVLPKHGVEIKTGADEQSSDYHGLNIGLMFSGVGAPPMFSKDSPLMTKESIVINGFLARRVIIRASSGDVSMAALYYVIDVGTYQGLNAIIFVSADLAEGTNWQNTVDTIVKSISIDANKINQSALEENKLRKEAVNQQGVREERNKALANLTDIRVGAEMYYDKTGSYSGMCSSPLSDQVISGYLLKAKEFFGSNNFVCVSETGKYAISSMLKDGTFWCVDSLGYNGVVSSLNKQSSCRE